MTNNEIKLNKKATDYLKNKIGGGGSSGESGDPYITLNRTLELMCVGKVFDVDNFIALCEEKNVSLIFDESGTYSIILFFESVNGYDYMLQFYYSSCADGTVISISGTNFYKVVDETVVDLKTLLLANKTEIEASPYLYFPTSSSSVLAGCVGIINESIPDAEPVMFTYQEVISLFKDVE